MPGRPTVLIIEDEAITAHHLRQVLTKLGYEVLGPSPDGASALTVIAQDSPDILLADIGLPGEIDGIEVAAQARQRWNIPTVFLTAYTDAETMRRARITEPYGYLVKPFAEQELHATIEIALQQRDLSAWREREVRRTAEILGRTQDELSAVAERLFSAQEVERQRIARDLHDNVVQRLALLQIEVERLWGKVPAGVRDRNSADFDLTLSHVTDLANDLRALSHHLHPQILDDLGLETAVRELCESFEERHSIVTRFSVRDVPRQLSESIAAALYGIVQESLQNVAKHSGADSVDVVLMGSSANIELSVRDNGKGFDAGQRKPASGLGLISMAQRAQLAGGGFEVRSGPDHGTRIHASVPLEVHRKKGGRIETG